MKKLFPTFNENVKNVFKRATTPENKVNELLDYAKFFFGEDDATPDSLWYFLNYKNLKVWKTLASKFYPDIVADIDTQLAAIQKLRKENVKFKYFYN